jgi:hypothetical protein
VATAAGIFIAGNVITIDGAPLGGVVVVLSGATNAVTITNAKGEYRFDDLDPNQLYLVTPSRANYSFAPFNYTFSLIGNRTDAIFTAIPGAVAANPLDTPEFFVRQQYLDFLNRETDTAGFKFWSDQLNAQLAACKSDAACREDALARVSAALFLSVEFQKTGGTVYRAYRASFNRAPRLAESLPDAASIGSGVIVNQPNWQDQLAANTKSFFAAFASRPAFRQLYPESLSSVEFVDALNANVGAVLTFEERAALIADLDAGRKTRAEVLQQIPENQTFVKREFNRVFVLMEYFGCLRRNPDDAPDGNSDGYNFWLKKLDQFGGDYQAARMVEAFISSNEYRAIQIGGGKAAR